jgi:flagellar hook-length control protein FliK
VREQIVQQARLIRAENGSEMVIRLKPEHLGDMTLRISVSSEGAVTASFFTNNAEVRHIVENSLVQLRQELQNQGIKVDKAEVYAGLSDGGLPQGQSGEAWQQNRGNSSNSAFRNAEADALQFEDDAANISNVSNANISADDGVDYLV